MELHRKEKWLLTGIFMLAILAGLAHYAWGGIGAFVLALFALAGVAWLYFSN